MPDERDKAVQLIQYLKELATLRNVPVRNVHTYEETGEVLWLSECPHEQGVFTQAWGHNGGHNWDKWLEVHHQQEPPLPAVPDQCENWVNCETLQNENDLPEQPPLPTIPEQCKDWVRHESLRDKNNLPELTQQIENPDWHEGLDQPETIPQTKHLEDHPKVEQIWDRYVENEWLPWMGIHNAWEGDHLPKLLPEIPRQIPNPDWHEDLDQPGNIPQTQRLEDHPEVKQEWYQYIQDEWLPWKKEHDPWRRVNKVYSKLLAIRQKQLQFDEEYELILGLGLLTWQTSTGKHVRRHLVVADAFLEFEAHLGKFTVRPHMEGAKLRLELDMLEEQPALAWEEAQGLLEAAENNPWEGNHVEDTLQALINTITPQGEVEYAPALILRKRHVWGLTQTLTQIGEQIENDGFIPSEFARLAEIHPQDEPNQNDEPRETNAAFNNADLDDKVLFPLPSNNEQCRIVDRLRQTNGVLVKGPPGTGKSHTIANLICDLLAKGQRILVTAKKPRALQVLQGLLPEELRPLCISLLGSGPEERHTLEAAVNNMLNQMEDWDEDLSNQQINDKNHHWETLKGERAEIKQRIHDIRKSETHTNFIAEGAYQGAAARIAKAVVQNREQYAWFTDFVSWDTNCPCNISTNYLQGVLAKLRQFTPETRRELNLAWPQTLPSLELFANLVQNEKNANQEEQDSIQGADERLTDLLGKNDPSVIKAIRNAFSSFRDARRGLSIAAFPWVSDAVQDVLDGNPNLWRTRLSVTSNVIEEVGNLVETADQTTIEFPGTHNIKDLYKNARIIKEHMESGGKLGWWLFRSKTVRDRLYVITDAKINGHPCSTVQHFAELVDVLNVRFQCEQAWSFWEGQNEKTEGPYALQLATLQALRDALRDALALEKHIDKFQEINQHINMAEPTWADEAQIDSIISSCRLALARINRQHASKEIQNIENSISRVVDKNNAHSVTNDLLNAISNRNTDQFRQCANTIQNLKRQYQDLQKMDESLSDLRNMLPQLTNSMEQTSNESDWDERIEHIANAWRYGQARHWIEDYISNEDLPALNMRATEIEDEINDTIAELASLYAWSSCVARLRNDDDHMQHMMQHMVAWQAAMVQLGAGHGIHAHHHRHVAQGHLNECREAVPAWVMPLHRVWDIKPAPKRFDVIIVDEASQCGIEALPLFYLAKKIVIVGDNQQISPDAVGLDQAQMHQHMNMLLHDAEFGDTFDIQSSLFDHGRRLYVAQQITLREHFRCMPEIIRFSNNLCYADTPLISLRQYGADRLPPLKPVFVANGYNEIIGAQRINRPEARNVVEKIVEMCDCEEYDGKTMGVIVLQGTAQAQLIERQLLEHLGAEVMEERRLVCGNPSSFQGDQRDIILLSLVAARDENDEITFIALTDNSARRRFNVAASRAKDQMILFYSVTLDDLTNPRDLRRKLLEFFQNTQAQQIAGTDLNWDELERRAYQDRRQIGNQPQPFDSWFEVDVALELHRKNFKVVPQHEVANRRIDLVVEGRQAKLAVECYGDYWHGPEHYDKDMKRQRQLERCGWEFFIVRESAFRYEKTETLGRLQDALQTRGIFPDHGAIEPHEDNIG